MPTKTLRLDRFVFPVSLAPNRANFRVLFDIMPGSPLRMDSVAMGMAIKAIKIGSDLLSAPCSPPQWLAPFTPPRFISTRRD